jgi:hypothetical protein
MRYLHHCKHWIKPFAQYYLYANNTTFKYEVAAEFNCPHCHNWLYRSFHVKQDGQETAIQKISPKCWQEHWVDKIQTHLLAHHSQLAHQKIKLNVSDYSQKIHQPADKAIAYLKWRQEL